MTSTANIYMFIGSYSNRVASMWGEVPRAVRPCGGSASRSPKGGLREVKGGLREVFCLERCAGFVYVEGLAIVQ